ncbi:MAG: D-aminoacyl-tRNA deacylase [Inconstantimicrobium porci]|uniref:D-aminoacyl-tRNA deacylase n=1 Tax=Inconstantimicrobium porci TaxID=2652291 RepID=A0A7X2MVH5_9CLOT|nr:D-aminoacyl-tRNA deacylase [Inconstantimicrobium porci]MDD6770209.1 D-aminoacyl-tRNA deacylase [Inconstantimicrobium porci]MDY5912515.1 D-aminoacyl-tRNA deacylase [Inconstantimicrobium porci]MSR89848.1 D-tyrosyl-tRNA(Tyr) deacylase [Inconstantimicrobium porci]
MRAVVQRVKESSVKIDGSIVGKINKGFNVLIGISKDDTIDDLKYIKDKIMNLRVFEDENNKMNLSIKDVNGELLIVSQFTLYGDCRKGRRPNFMNALSGDEAEKLYEEFLGMIRQENIVVETGVFGADMEVCIINDGPVTLLIDSKKTF